MPSIKNKWPFKQKRLGTTGIDKQTDRQTDRQTGRQTDRQTDNHQYYNLRYNPSAPFVCSGFLVSYRIRLAIKTTEPRTAPHLKYIQGIGIPNKASFEIHGNEHGIELNNAKWRSIEASNNVNKHTGHGLLVVDSLPE